MSALCPRNGLKETINIVTSHKNTAGTAAETRADNFSPKAEVTSSNLVGCTKFFF